MLRWLPEHKDIAMTRGEDCSSLTGFANLVNSGWTLSGNSGKATVRLNYWINEMNVKEGGVDWTKLPENNATEIVDDGGGHGELVTLRSLKCPAGVEYPDMFATLATYFPKTPIIIGLRHPVLWFESFWNYRVTKQRVKFITKHGLFPFPDMVKNCKMGAGKPPYTCRGEFHSLLAIMGRTELAAPDEIKLFPNLSKILDRRRKKPQLWNRTVPNPVFLYEINQLKENSAVFKHDLLSFANVDPNFPMPDMYKVTPGTANAEYRTKETKYTRDTEKNMIDICHEEHVKAKEHLMEIARNSSEWITEYFMKSPGVVTSTTFLDHVSNWKVDPA